MSVGGRFRPPPIVLDFELADVFFDLAQIFVNSPHAPRQLPSFHARLAGQNRQPARRKGRKGASNATRLDRRRAAPEALSRDLTRTPFLGGDRARRSGRIAACPGLC